MSVLLDILCESLSACMQNMVGFYVCKFLRPPHTMCQPRVDAYMYFGLTTVIVPVVPL